MLIFMGERSDREETKREWRSRSILFFCHPIVRCKAWILLRGMLLDLSRRRRQQVKDLCNDIDAVNGPSVLLV